MKQPEAPNLKVSPEYIVPQDRYRIEKHRRDQKLSVGMSGAAFFLTSSHPNFSAIELHAAVEWADGQPDRYTQERRAGLKISNLDGGVFAELEGRVINANDYDRGLWLPCDFNNAYIQYGENKPLKIRAGFIRKQDWYPPDIWALPRLPEANIPDNQDLLPV